MEKELAQVTPDEFKEANPNGYALLVHEVAAEGDKKVAEMQEQLDAADEDKKLVEEIKAALKLDKGEDMLTKIGHLMTRLGEKAKIAVTEALDAVLKEKVADDDTRKVVMGLMQVKVAEMQDAASAAPDLDSANRIVREMTTAEFDSNDVIQMLVSEQAAPIIRRREEIAGAGGTGDTDKALAAQGMPRQRVMMGG